ncbi:hypothetical protein BJV74DRAFT_247373 [Russula compacta]|nr:hypothetical protein BJV74DRAFT_247373 [Russula compacta]
MPAIVDIQSSFGAVFIGLFVSTILFGVTLTQTWIYYHSGSCRERDPKTLKWFIALLVVMDTLHSILCFYTLYWYLILNYGNLASLEDNMWAMNAQIGVNTLVAFSVQLFYARRVYLMSHSFIPSLIIAGMSCLYFGLGIEFLVKIWIYKSYSRYKNLMWQGTIALTAAASADVLIAASMFWCLYRYRSGLAKTNLMITNLMIYSVSTGLVTSILGVSMLISFLAVPSGVISQPFFWTLGKCYMNSLLAMLNNRDLLRGRSTGPML